MNKEQLLKKYDGKIPKSTHIDNELDKDQKEAKKKTIV